jgi:hypothetical protein
VRLPVRISAGTLVILTGFMRLSPVHSGNFRNYAIIARFQILFNSLQKTLANPFTFNPDRNMKNEDFCSQLSTYFKTTHGI